MDSRDNTPDDNDLEEVEFEEENEAEPEDEGTAEEEVHQETTAAGNIMKLLPIHAAPYSPRSATSTPGGGEHLKVKRQRGRPRKVERMATTEDLEYHAKMVAEKAKFIDVDPVVLAARKHADPMAMLAVVKSEVATEQAALHFQRIENEKHGRDTSQVSSRRIDALKKIADIELEIKKLGADVIDIHGEKFQLVFKLWIEAIREVAVEVLGPEQVDLFFNRLQTKLEGWEDRASETLR